MNFLPYVAYFITYQWPLCLVMIVLWGLGVAPFWLLAIALTIFFIAAAYGVFVLKWWVKSIEPNSVWIIQASEVKVPGMAKNPVLVFLGYRLYYATLVGYNGKDPYKHFILSKRYLQMEADRFQEVRKESPGLRVQVVNFCYGIEITKY